VKVGENGTNGGDVAAVKGKWREGLSPNAVQQFRLRAGMTRAQLGEALGASDSAVAFWEQGKSVPTDDKQEKLLEIMTTPAPAPEVTSPPPEAPRPAKRRRGSALPDFLRARRTSVEEFDLTLSTADLCKLLNLPAEATEVTIQQSDGTEVALPFKLHLRVTHEEDE
jgi:transcriptional regulator with XRE-family HTH domain